VTGLNIRNAMADDALAIAALQVEASRAAYELFVPSGYFDGLAVGKRTAVWKQLIAAKRGDEQIIVGEEGKLLRAYAHYGRSRDPDAVKSTGELFSLYVAPAHWRCGFGQQLLAAGLRGLVSMRFDAATLWVLALNEPARRFYERSGGAADGIERGINPGISEARYWISTRAAAMHFGLC
jgi:ribosomal protein S18 acetylase RimI-like enzyme